jgi:hypothetical protein
MSPVHRCRTAACCREPQSRRRRSPLRGCVRWFAPDAGVSPAQGGRQRHRSCEGDHEPRSAARLSARERPRSSPRRARKARPTSSARLSCRLDPGWRSRSRCRSSQPVTANATPVRAWPARPNRRRTSLPLDQTTSVGSSLLLRSHRLLVGASPSPQSDGLNSANRADVTKPLHWLRAALGRNRRSPPLSLRSSIGPR